MSHVLTLVSDPAAPALTPALVDAAATALGETGTPLWLQDGVACDLPCPAPVPLAIIEAALEGAPVDLALQPADTRRRRLLIADMDSTIITVECIDEIADLLGLRGEVAAITERAMQGELEFDGALRERVALLKGLDGARLEAVYRDRVTFTPGAAALVGTMRAHDAFTALVSGGFSFFAGRVEKALGFHWSQANDLEIDDANHLTGQVIPPILGREAKAHALQAIALQQDIPLSAALAIGDGANDLAMIRLAGMGVAFRAKPAVAAEANVSIRHGDLTAALFFQGYARDEFVTAGQ